MAIAADLHGFAAHHVTGILVQTPMARMMATTRPDDLAPVLAGIERATIEALASMRRTAGVLRDTEDADRRPVDDLAAAAELADAFANPVRRVTLRRDPAVCDDVPHEVQAAAFRVDQEALTNVRRHAVTPPRSPSPWATTTPCCRWRSWATAAAAPDSPPRPAAGASAWSV